MPNRLSTRPHAGDFPLRKRSFDFVLLVPIVLFNAIQAPEGATSYIEEETHDAKPDDAVLAGDGDAR